MAKSSLWAVQQAVYSKLNANATLAGKVFDTVPQGQAYPYVTLGDATETPEHAHARFGRQATLTIHVWSQYAGAKEVQELMDTVTQLLDYQPLSVTDFGHVYSRVEFSETMRDADGITRHGVLRVRIFVQEA